MSKFSYNLTWARYYLKRFGLIDNSVRGIWALNPDDQRTKTIDKEAVKKKVQDNDCITRRKKTAQPEVDETDDSLWETEVLDTLKKIKPEAFERLSQRILREAGFVQVQVTGRSSDGGIDGRGVLKIGSILSFHVHFQCKRYKDTVSASVIRDFRGGMVGRADKGVIITTGTFTRDAKLEAIRDGAPPLDLVDGDELAQMLETFRLGISVKEKVSEEIAIDKSWFLNF
jgi:restriction system protein